MNEYEVFTSVYGLVFFCGITDTFLLTRVVCSTDVDCANGARSTVSSYYVQVTSF